MSTLKTCSVDPKEVMTTDKSGKIFLNREEITKGEAQTLKEEAMKIKRMKVWKVFQNTVKQQAIDKAILTSTTWEHTLAGKMMVHNLGILEGILQRIENFKLD